MKILDCKENDVCIISFEKPCYLDNASEDYFRKTVEHFLAENENVFVDFGNLSYINSSGLGALIRVYTTSKEKSRVFKIFNPQDRINSFFKITKMNTLFQIYPTLEEARESL